MLMLKIMALSDSTSPEQNVYTELHPLKETYLKECLSGTSIVNREFPQSNKLEDLVRLQGTNYTALHCCSVVYIA